LTATIMAHKTDSKWLPKRVYKDKSITQDGV